MPSVTDDDEFATGPILGELPWDDERASKVKAAVNQNARNAGKAAHFSQENFILKPSVVAPIMGDDACKSQPEVRPLVPRVRRMVRMHGYESHLPIAPVSRSLLAHGWIRGHQEAMVSLNQAAITLLRRDSAAKAVPWLRKQYPDPTGYPVDLPWGGGRNADKDHLADAMRMPFGVSERERGPPGYPEYQPSLNAEVPTQEFDIGEQMAGRVGGEVGVRIAGMRRASSASALVEKDDPIKAGIEVTAHPRGAPGTRSSMQDQSGLAGRVAPGLPVHMVPIADAEHATIVRFDVWIPRGHDISPFPPF